MLRAKRRSSQNQAPAPLLVSAQKQGQALEPALALEPVQVQALVRGQALDGVPAPA